MFAEIKLNAIREENARELVQRLLNVVEQLSGEVRELRVVNQRLRDENNRLKGEQGKPDIKGNKKQAQPEGRSLVRGRTAQKTDAAQAEQEGRSAD